jgi:hypothetical protein
MISSYGVGTIGKPGPEEREGAAKRGPTKFFNNAD